MRWRSAIQSFQSTIGATKPVIVGVAVTPIDAAKTSTIVLFGDVTHVLGPFGTYAQQVLHAKTAALVYPNIAGITQGATAIAESLQKVGVKVKKVGYDESQTDLIGPLTSAGATSADIVIPYSDSSGCVNLAKGLKQLGITDTKKILSRPAVPQRTGRGRPGRRLPDLDLRDRQLAVRRSDRSGHAGVHEGDGQSTGLPPWRPTRGCIVTFGQILTTVRFLNELGYGHITPQAILQKAKAFKGPVALGAPSLDCGKYATAPGICNDRTQFFLYKGKHAFVKTAGWLQPPHE